MASTLKHLRSSTSSKRPTASGLSDGQFAINTASGTPGVFFKDSNGTVVKVGPAHVGTTAPNAVPAGSAGNSLGELWVDNSLTTAGLNYYTGSTFVNLTPSGTTTVVGLVELATPAETQAGTDAVRAVTPSGLQSKVSDSTSTTSSTTIASSTAVKSAYDLANAALPKAGGTVTGELLIGNTGSLVFEGSTDDSFETTLTVTDPTADRTITFPNITGTVITTGDTGTVTSTMIADGAIVNADINASAAIAYSKLALSSGIVNTDINASAAIAGTKISPDFGSQNVITTGIVSHALGTQGAPTVSFTGDTNTGIYSPGADQLAISTGGSGRVFIGSTGTVNFTGGGTAGSTQAVSFNGSAPVNSLVIDSTGKVGVGTSSPSNTAGFSQQLELAGSLPCISINQTNASYTLRKYSLGVDAIGGFGAWDNNASAYRLYINSSGSVGIGVSSPSYLLDCKSTGATNVARFLTGATTSSEVAQFGRIDQAVNLSIDYDGTGAMGIGTTTAHPFNLKTGAVTRATIDTSGRLGIGTASPDVKLHVATGNATGYIKIDGGTSSQATNGLQFLSNSGGSSAEVSHYQSNLSFYTAGNERARIDSSGRLLVGTSSGQGDALLQVQGLVGNATGWGVARLTRGLNTAAIGANVGALLGDVEFGANDNTTAARIRCESDATWSSTSDTPGRLVFSTTADGASSPTERMRITNEGNVLLATSAAGLFVGTTTDGAYRIGRSSFGVSSGTLYIGNAAIQVSSDARLKENIEDTSLDALDIISRVSVKDFTWNDPSDTSQNNRNARGKWTGLIAQELVEVLPFVVNAPRDKNGEIDHNSESIWTLDQSQLCPVLIKAIQQQQEIIAGLEARLSILEAQ